MGKPRVGGGGMTLFIRHAGGPGAGESSRVVQNDPPNPGVGSSSGEYNSQATRQVSQVSRAASQVTQAASQMSQAASQMSQAASQMSQAASRLGRR